MQKMLSYLLYVLPKNWLSRLFGEVMQWQLPGPLRLWSLRWFAKAFSIDLSEAEKPLDEYPSIGALFIRHLKSGVRPIAAGPIVHPADSEITQSQEIGGGRLIQAKGKSYSVAEFVGSDELAKRLEGGWSLTYYLCPTDYHRVHAPLDGKIRRVRHLPGALWPVNAWSVERISQLFAVNERVVVEIETEAGLAVLVMVGATNVGKMTMSFDSDWITNSSEHREVKEKVYSPARELSKGDEVGVFHMGSTVIMLYPKELVCDEWSALSGSVKVGGSMPSRT